MTVDMDPSNDVLELLSKALYKKDERTEYVQFSIKKKPLVQIRRS